jgi:sec-independent protein translocase protein TatA
MAPLFAIFSLTPWEILIILVIGVLLFGRRLPEVGRYLGKGITEFKKGVKGLEDEMDLNSPVHRPEHHTAIEQIKPPQKVSTTAPKFEDAPSTAITAPPKV